MSKETEEGQSVERVLRASFPLPDGDEHYVTRGEFVRELHNLEKAVDMKLTHTEVRLQKWIMGGILTFIVTVGIGGFSAYASLMGQLYKITTVSEAASRANDRLDARSQWIIQQERRDTSQDEVLKTLAPNYTPPVRTDVPQ